MYDKRRQADYEQASTTVNVEALNARTEKFVTDMAAVIDEDPAES